MDEPNELFVPPALAKKLKEVGFDKPCMGVFEIFEVDGTIPRFRYNRLISKAETSFEGMWFDHNKPKKEYEENHWWYWSAPMHEQVLNWFREQNIDIWISPDYSGKVKRKKNVVYGWDISTANYDNNQGGFHNYYEAINEAIEEAIKLIPISKLNGGLVDKK